MPDLLALPLRRFHPKRYRPGNLGTWSGHLPFANDLVWAQRPELLVELGTHCGESYFGFCQAVKESGSATRCFAVDTWRGDEHAGFYGEEVYQDVEAYNRTEYQPFSTLLRATFDEASSRFERDSIDLLHIDGLHTYPAVKLDFETWLPKVKPGGLVLLHDIAVRHADFEVWRFWDEISQRFPHFEFRHCWGLGVLRKPGGDAASSDLLKLLFEADQPTAEKIRSQYSEAAELLDLRARTPEMAQAAAEADRPYLQIFPGTPEGGFEERNSALSNIEAGVWRRHLLELPQGAPSGIIRIDLVNRAALIEISEIAVSLTNGQSVLEIRGAAELAAIRCQGQLTRFDSGAGARFFSWGGDPQLLLELQPTGLPLRIEIAMQVKFDLEPLRQQLRRFETQAAERELELDSLRKNVHRKVRLEWDLAFTRTQLRFFKSRVEEAELRSEHFGRFLGDLRAEVLAQNEDIAAKEQELRELRERVSGDAGRPGFFRRIVRTPSRDS